MKNSTKIFIALTSLVLLAACQQKAVYVTSSFVRFASTSMSVAEDTGTVSIPVYAYQLSDGVAFNSGAKATTSVTIELTDSTAKAGTDYELVDPANGVLEFQEDSVQYITVRIIERPREVTGTLRFSVKLSSATNGFTMGATSEMEVSITDNDKDYDELLGSYTATATYYSSGYPTTTWTMVVEEYDGSEGNRKITSGITPYCDADRYGQEGPIYVTLSDDQKTFTITLPQFTGYYYSSYSAWEAFVVFTGSGYYSSSMDITFNYAAGQWTSDNGILYALSSTESSFTYYSYFEGVLPGIVLEAQ